VVSALLQDSQRLGFYSLPGLLSSSYKYNADHLLYTYRVALVIIVLETNFFEDKCSVQLDTVAPKDHNDPQLHIIIYPQVAIISQALIFVTRSHGFFFMGHRAPSLVPPASRSPYRRSRTLTGASPGSMESPGAESVSSGWNIIWFLPLDLVKSAMKATVLKYLHWYHEAKMSREITNAGEGVPMTRGAVLGGLDPTRTCTRTVCYISNARRGR